MRIFAEFPVYGQSGWEVICRETLLILDKLGVQIQLNHKDNWNLENCLLDEEDIERIERMQRTSVGNKAVHLLHQYPSKEYLDSSYFKQAFKAFCLSLFETTKCPAPWVSRLNLMTKTLVYSEFNKTTYANSGVKNADVIPFGINTKMFNPSVEPFNFDHDKDDFVFITNGDFTERKNFEGLIEAYVKEFTSKEKVCLVIKAHYSGFIKRFQDNCVSKIKEVINRFNSIDPPKIYFLGTKIPWYDMPRFYTAGDCFVLFSRGEGIGLPYAEALSCEVPVIATTFGGHTQFLNESNALFVNSDIRVIDDMEYIRKCLWALNHSWAFPEVNDLRNKMRFAFEFRDIMKEKAQKGRADMEQMTWMKAGLAILRRCYET